MYHQNQHNLQFRNLPTPTGNPQNAASTSFRSITSPYPHSTSSFQQVQQAGSPRVYEIPTEVRMPNNRNYYFKSQPLNSFANQTSNVQNNYYDKPLYAAKSTTFVLPNNMHRFETRSSNPQATPPMQYNMTAAAVPPPNINKNLHTLTLTSNSNQNLNTWIEPNAGAIKSYEKEATAPTNPGQGAARAITKKNENEKIRIFTGTAEKVIKWHKIYKNFFCYYEIVASIVSIQEGAVPLQKIMLLRDKKGPIIQIIHYVWDHINIENFFVGQMLRCIGRMVGPNIMHGLSIREATQEEVATIQRMSYISDHAISRALVKV